MAQDEKFLSRWSRLKHEAKKEPAQEPADTPAPQLPALDELTPDSDFSGFMHPKVEDALRRAALKKLFNDPQFNVPDPFEPFSGDWTGGDAIPDEMMATLNQARTLLFDEKKKEAEKTAAGEAPPTDPTAKDDAPGRQDHEPGRQDT